MSWSERFVGAVIAGCVLLAAGGLLFVAISDPFGRLLLAVYAALLGVAALIATATGKRA